MSDIRSQISEFQGSPAARVLKIGDIACRMGNYKISQVSLVLREF